MKKHFTSKRDYFILLTLLCFIVSNLSFASSGLKSPSNRLKPVKHTKGEVTYQLTVDYKTLSIKGQAKKAMAINNSIPAPTLYFKEGEKAIIYVKNNMKVETSVHWHGILLPNYEDGVAYLTSPPIRPGKQHRFEFMINQPPGTYWYHSHTKLQEQDGLYGAIVIEPKIKQVKYDKDLTLVLSDWTYQKPYQILRTLKRGSEWYSIKKGTVISFWDVIKNKALGAQLTMWKSRMPGMDISDIYYPAFLINGAVDPKYPEFKAGERIRLRLVNASASTYFWLTFGGGKALMVAADGVNIQPVRTNKILHAVAETYDFLLKIPYKKSLEFRISAQDGSGSVSAIIGKGELLKAPVVPAPDLIEGMKAMAKSHSGGHHHGHNTGGHESHKKPESHNKQEHKSDNKQEHHKHHKSDNKQEHHNKREIQSVKQDDKNTSSHTNHQHSQHQQHTKKHQQHKSHTNHQHSQQASLPIATHYKHLKSLEKTNFSKKAPVREIKMNLTGNMWRYVWSINGKALSEVDKIKIHKGEVTRLILNNSTMMHHPMHLHGHFFRVLNGQGQYSPLKHTVDVPPMEQVVIEFEPTEKGDWFFHCHVLYHMKQGMSRIFSYGDTRDPRLKNYPINKVLKADRHWYKWGELDLMSHRLNLEAVISNTKNKVALEGVYSWFDNKYKINHDGEVELFYERFVSDFFRLYGELELSLESLHEFKKTLDDNEDIDWNDVFAESGYLDTAIKEIFSARLGIKYLLPYFFDFGLSLSHRGELEVSLDYDLMLLSRLELFAEGESSLNLIDMDFKDIDYEWQVGLEYAISQSFSLIGSYDNRFGWGAGLHIKL